MPHLLGLLLILTSLTWSPTSLASEGLKTRICGSIMSTQLKLSEDQWFDKLFLEELVSMTEGLNPKQLEQYLSALDKFETKNKIKGAQATHHNGKVRLRHHMLESPYWSRLVLLHEFQHVLDYVLKSNQSPYSSFTGVGKVFNTERPALLREYNFLRRLTNEQQMEIDRLPVSLSQHELAVLNAHGLLDENWNFEWSKKAEAMMDQHEEVRLILSLKLQLKANFDLKLEMYDAFHLTPEQFVTKYLTHYRSEQWITTLTSPMTIGLVSGTIAYLGLLYFL